MPQVRPVVLNYLSGGPSAQFGPTPREVPVKPSDSIQFQIGTGTRAQFPGCKLRITVHDGSHFSPSVLQHSTAQNGEEPLVLAVLPSLATVLAALPAGGNPVISGYACELLDSRGEPIPGLSSDGPTGGEIVPDRGA